MRMMIKGNKREKEVNKIYKKKKENKREGKSRIKLKRTTINS